MMTLAERCRAQARSMDLEGWYVCANVLREAADCLEAIEERAGELASIRAKLAEAERALEPYVRYPGVTVSEVLAGIDKPLGRQDGG